MEVTTVLCLDAESMRYPELIGLDGENLLSQPWLRTFSSAYEARSFLKSQRVENIWVASSEDIDPINCAAAFKQDCPAAKVCLLASQDSGSLQSRATHAGIDEVLDHAGFMARYAQEKQLHRAGLPVSPVQQVFADAPQGTHNAFFMPIMSGSGGAGKSTIASLSAIIAHNRGYKTLLLDLDLQFGDMEHVLGLKDVLNIDDLLDNPAKLSAVQSQGNLPALIAAPRRFERAEEIAAALPALLESLRSCFDVIVANTGGFWAEQHAVVLERSSKTLFLVDQRPSSLCACRRALELCARCGIATSPLLFAVNRCSKSALYSSIDVSCALRGAPAIELRDGGSEVEEFVSAGHPSELFSRQNNLGDSLGKLMDDVLPRGVAVASPAHLPAPARKRQRNWLRTVRGRDAACLG